VSDNDIGAFLNRDREHPDARFDAPSSRSTNRKGAHIGVRGKCWVTEFCWARVPRRRSADGPTAWEACPQSIAGQFRILDLSSTFVALVMGYNLRGYRLVDFGRAAIVIL
jgi:hypothetical protein